MTRLSIILLMGLMAFVLRALPQLFFAGRKFPAAWDRWLRYVSYSMICSIIAVTLFLSGAHFESAAAPRRALALAVCIFVARRSQSAVTGMIVGAFVVLGLTWLLNTVPVR